MKPDTLATLSEWIRLAAKQVDLPDAVKSWDGDVWQWEWFDRRSSATRRLSVLVGENDEELYLTLIGSAWADSPRRTWSNTFLTVPLAPDPNSDTDRTWLEKHLLKAWAAAREKADDLSSAATPKRSARESGLG